MRPWRNRRLMVVLLLILWSVIFFVAFVCKFYSKEGKHDHDLRVELLWWTDMPSGYEVMRRCGRVQCLVTSKKSRLSDVRAVLFYAPNLNIFDMPVPRSNYKVWALLHDESPRNVPFMPYDEFLQHFNYTSTFSQYSDLPLTTQHLPLSQLLVNSDFFLSPEARQAIAFNTGNSEVVFLQTDCDTMSGREDYVRELMKHIQIDSYGGCLHNRDLPNIVQTDYLNQLYSSRMLGLLNGYKFMIAIENGVCEDYITEKFWRPLVMGVVPIYFGAPNIREWQPNDHSVIYVDDFESPYHLAEHLKMLSSNETAFRAYLPHKFDKQNPISSKKLRNELLARRYSIVDKKLFREFECMACQRLSRHPVVKQTANVSHYNCPLPPAHVPLSGQGEPGNKRQWRSIMAVGRCKAQLLNKYWLSRRAYTRAEFNAELERLVAAGLCE